MATAHSVSSINLLPKGSFEFSTAGKVLKWITTVGRVLVVLTEFVVLLAFISRFYFDRKLADLGDVLVQKEAQIAAYDEVETEMRKVLTKQGAVETFEGGGIGFSGVIESLSAVLPEGTVLDSVSLKDDDLTVSGKSPSEYGYAQFVNGLKKMPAVNKVTLKDTSFDQVSGGVKFSIQVNMKQ